MKKVAVTKNNLKIFFLLCFFTTLFENAFSQAIQYKYDYAGNRIVRKLNVSGMRLRHNIDSTGTSKSDTTTIPMLHSISAYPNPTNEYVNISINGFTSGEKATVQLVDQNGHLVNTFQTNSAISQVNMSSYNSGVYFVNVFVGQDKMYYRVVKME